LFEDAERQGKLGVAVVTSDGAFMAGKELFLKNGLKWLLRIGNFGLLCEIFAKRCIA
jgi:hypothetical protein